MASSSSNSKPKRGFRNLLKEALHVRPRSTSPSQPLDSKQQPDLRGSTGVLSNPQAKAPSHQCPDPTGTPVNTERLGDELDSEHAFESTEMGVPRPAPVPNAAWATLRDSLRSLKDSSSAFPTLLPAIEELLACLGRLEVVAKGWPDYEDLAVNLAILSDSIRQPIREAESTIQTNALLGVVMLIQRRVATLKEVITRQDPQSGTYRRGDSKVCYWLVLTLFRQLEANLIAGIWSVANENAVGAWLEGLNPAKISTYNSGTLAHIRRTCTKGTRAGVLAELNKWADDPAATPVCWMSGTEGTGKTTITSTFCERLDGQKLLAASFFCTRTSAECKTPTRIMPTIAHQLARYSAPFQRALYEAMTNNPGIELKDGPERFGWMVIQSLAKARDSIPPNAVVVIDALDECEDQERLNDLIEILDRCAEQTPFKLLITSRHKREACGRAESRNRPVTAIHLDDINPALVRTDIGQYLKVELGSLALTTTRLKQLIDRTESFFVCAAILVRFILLEDPRSSSHDRLELVLSMTPESTKKHTYVDSIYRAILGSMLDEKGIEVNEKENARITLWTVLFTQESINIETIAALAGINDLQQVRSALRLLRPVLLHSEESGLVSSVHASFPEFVLNHERSGAFFYDVAAHSQLVTERCFEAMNAGLRFNICELESSLIPDQMVKGLEIRAKENISSTLGYACRHWASHLELAAKCDCLVRALEAFLSHRLLFWMEVLNLRREMGLGVQALIKTRRWLKLENSASSNLLLLVQDACDFVTGYTANAISQSTPHIYISALPFTPPSSRVYQIYSRKSTGLLDLPSGVMEHRKMDMLTSWKTPSDVCSVTYSPDGGLVAIGCRDGTLSVRCAYDGSQVFGPHLIKYDEAVTSVAFSSDGSKLAAAGWGGLIQVCNVANWSPFPAPPLEGIDRVASIAFSPDGARIATASGPVGSVVRIWKVKDGTLAIGPLEGHTQWVTSLAFSPDGMRLASASRDRTIRVWDVRGNIPSLVKLATHSLNGGILAFSLDGERVCASEDGAIIVSNTLDGSAKMLSIPTHLSDIAALPGGRRIIAESGDRPSQVWDVDDELEMLIPGPFLMKPHWHPRWMLAPSPGGTQAITTNRDTIRFWSLRDDVFPVTRFENNELSTTSMVFSPTESRIYSTSARGTVLWNIAQERTVAMVFSGKQDSRDSLPISPSGDNIAVFLDDHSVEVLSIKTGALVHGPFRGHTDLVTSAAFSCDGTYLVTGSKDRTVRVWDMVHDRLEVGPLVGHGDTVTSVTFSPAGSRILSYSADQSIRMWNVQDSIVEAVNSHISDDFFSADDASQILQGCTMHDDGWLTNGDSSFIFWFPQDFPAKPSPHTEMCITQRHGPLRLPNQKVLLGRKWRECWIGG